MCTEPHAHDWRCALLRSETRLVDPDGVRPGPLTFSASRPSRSRDAAVSSDPVPLTVPPDGDLPSTCTCPGNTRLRRSPPRCTMARSRPTMSRRRNHVGSAQLPTVATVQNWFVISRVDVQAPGSVGGLVTFGIPLLTATRSTPDTNSRWPDQLVRRMLSQVAPSQDGCDERRHPPATGSLSEGAFQAASTRWPASSTTHSRQPVLHYCRDWRARHSETRVLIRRLPPKT